MEPSAQKSNREIKDSDETFEDNVPGQQHITITDDPEDQINATGSATDVSTSGNPMSNPSVGAPRAIEPPRPRPNRRPLRVSKVKKPSPPLEEV